jgi:hypothetical protein
MAFYRQYLNIQDSAATPANTFFVDSTSVDNGNNTGWVFVNGIFVFPTTNVATAQLGTPSIAGNADVDIYNSNLKFLDVRDCIAAGLNLPFYASGSIDSGNNQNWVLNPDAIPGTIQTTGVIGTVDFVGNNTLEVTGIQTTGEVGTVIASANANATVTGLDITSALEGVTVTGSAGVFPNGLTSTGFVNLVQVIGVANVDVTGVSSVTALDSVVVIGRANINATGVSTTSALGDEAVTAIVFNYSAVAQLYDKNRTVYVNKRSTSRDRTVYVA